MLCPKCGSKFRVANTASNGDTSRLYLRATGDKLLSWYSKDYVIRQRFCNSCLYTSVTLEVEDLDLLEMFKIISKEGIPPDLEDLRQKMKRKDK